MMGTFGSLLDGSTETETVNPVSRLDALCEGHNVSEGRKDVLARAIALGADDSTLAKLRDAVRVSRKADGSILLPEGRYNRLSRGSGWARLGRGDQARWGEREDGGYRVREVGRWIVGSYDGFARKEQTEWTVERVRVGEESWAVAS